MRSKFFVIDVESIGLHGEAFAVAWVAVDGARTVGEEVIACLPERAVGRRSHREWCAANIPPIPATEPRPSCVRDTFWIRWCEYKEQGYWLAADCCWPVEARFLAACVDDHVGERTWEGPYPLIDIGSVLFAVGLDPLGTYQRFPSELPVHDPLADARQSARLLLEAIAVGKEAASRPGRFIVKSAANCDCGEPLPWHLFELGELTHTCSCGRVYESKGGKVHRRRRASGGGLL